MDPSELESFNKRWKERLTLMVGQHWDECRQAEAEAEAKKQSAIENARLQEASLSHRADSPADLNEKKRKIHEEREATLKSIDKECDERICLIKELQLKEQENHHKAYREALADRSHIDRAPPVHSPPSTTAATTTTTTVTTTGVTETAAGEGIPSISQALVCRSSGSPAARIPPAEDASLTPAVAQEKHQPTISGKGFSVTVQREFAADGREQYVLRYKTKNRKALQDSTSSQVKQPSYIDTAELTPTPSSIDPTVGNQLSAPRTVTFDEVYRNGRAKHKDTIVEYPLGCSQWYILKCEEHAIRFTRNPLLGAAKHLNGRVHGNIPRSSAKAIQMLGYQVIDCSAQLAMLNNRAVNQAYENGYKPISIINPENKKKRRKEIAAAAANITEETSDSCNQKVDATPIRQRKGVPSQTNELENNPSTPSRGARSTPQKPPREIITNPKAFHVYYCFWSDDRSFYPVMILGWDDQRPGGLEHGLADTGLLDKEQSNVPSCYIYKDPESATNAAIAGWSPGFEDGGPRVNQRKFPVMFFDEDSNVSWVSATSLSKFPLYEPAPSKKEDHPFNAARRWIAKKEGFSSWEEFEKAQQRIAPSLNKTPSFLGMRSGSVTTPLVSPITNANDSSDDSETDTSTRSPTSNVTEEELQAMQDTAGEIDGDSDYTGSDMDGTLGDEYFAWEHPEADGRPWAFYDLRNADCVNTGLPNSTHRNTPDATEAALSAHEIVEAARTQGDSYSEMKDSARELSPIGGFLKEAVEHPAEDNDVKTSSSTPMTSQNNTDVINHAAPLPEGGTVSAHTAQAHDENGAEGSLLTPLHTSTDLPRAAAAPLPPLPPPPVQSELEEVPKILKRMRSEEKTEMDSGTLGQDHAKKAKLTINTTNHGVVRPAVPDSDAARFFLPNVPLGPAAFELSFYSKGPLCWKRENEGSSIELYYGEGNRKVATVDGLLDIVIDPTKLRGFVKEEVPASNGNYMVTLLAMDPGDSPVQVVFDRAKGSKSDIGKIQLRSFLRWLWDVVPTLPLLERGENTGEVHLAQ